MSRGQNFKIFLGVAMPPDPLAGAYQVCFAHYVNYVAHEHLINSHF